MHTCTVSRGKVKNVSKYTNLLLFLCILVLILLCLVLHVQKVLKTGFWNPCKIYTFVCFRRHLTGMYNLKIQHFKNTGVLEDVAYKLLLWSLEFKTRADKGVRKEESYGLRGALVIRVYQLKHMLEKKDTKRTIKEKELTKSHAEEHLCWQNKLQVQRITMWHSRAQQVWDWPMPLLFKELGNMMMALCLHAFTPNSLNIFKVWINPMISKKH